MKTYKVTIVFWLLSFMVLGTLWILGLFSESQVQEYGGRITLLLVVLGLGFGVMLRVLTPGATPTSNDATDHHSNGPKF